MRDPQAYLISSKFFLQLLGAIYFFAFGAFLLQIRGLLGKDGILPVERFLMMLRINLGKKSFYKAPTVFWINSSDAALIAVTAAGAILSILLLLNIYPPLTLTLLYILYFSIITIGQDFLSFGWEIFLLEITFNAIFLSLTPSPNPFIWISLNLLLFRFHFQGGAVKFLSGDVNWRNLTAVAYHYESQPLPNTLAWYVYKLPLWFHKFSTGFMFFVELIIPFGIFFTNEDVRLITFAFLVTLQLFIWLTGNFSYLNHLTVAFCIILVSDKFLGQFFGTPEPYQEAPLFLNLIISLIGAILITLQIICLWNNLMPRNPFFQKILRWLRPYHIVNRYGIFAVMTTQRFEIIVEGSDDRLEWKEYLFRYKPSEVNRRPRRISPYQPRLDWQAWFLPFSYFEEETWFRNFLYRLLVGSKPVLALLRYNPFPDHPPRYVRALVYLYKFSDAKTKKENGNWWTREYIGSYCFPMSLRKEEVPEFRGRE